MKSRNKAGIGESAHGQKDIPEPVTEDRSGQEN